MKSTALGNIVEWKKLSNRIAEQFLYHYFDDLDPYYWWVSDDVGGILCYGDYFISFDTILTCYKLGITEEQLINWYDFCLENHSVNISLAKFILSPEDKKEVEEKHLEELKNRVKSAEKTLKQALDKYENRD